MSRYVIVLLFLAMVSAKLGLALTPRKCNIPGSAVLHDMTITGCTAFPCTISRATEIKLIFTPARDSIGMTSIRLAVLGSPSSQVHFIDGYEAGVKIERTTGITTTAFSGTFDLQVRIVNNDQDADLCVYGSVTWSDKIPTTTSPPNLATGLTSSFTLLMVSILSGFSQL